MCSPLRDQGCKFEPIRVFQCDWGNVVCETQKAFDAAMWDLGEQILEMTSKAMGSVASLWLNTPYIDVKASSGPVPVGVRSGEHASHAVGGVDVVNSVLGWVMWIALGVCVLSLILAGVRMAWHARSGDSQQHIDRLGTILFATILISGCVGLVTGVLQPGDSQGSTGVAFIQNATWWYTVAFGAFGVIVGGVRMAWEQRADAGRDLMRSLLTLLVVAGIGLSVISFFQLAGDEFSKWVIGKALECPVVNGECFHTKTLSTLLPTKEMKALGVIGMIFFGIIAFLVALIQIVLLIIRNGLLVILAGMLPLSAAATNTATGKQMLSKTVGWTIGFLLYKPVAAIIYAAAFKIPQNHEEPILSLLTGITLMVMSLLALPAMMTLIVPAVGNVTGGGGGAAAGVAAAALPTGAIMLSKGNGGAAGGRGAPGPAGGAAMAAGSGPSSPSGSSGSGGWAPPNAADRRPTGGPSGAGNTSGGSSSGGGAGNSSSSGITPAGASAGSAPTPDSGVGADSPPGGGASSVASPRGGTGAPSGSGMSAGAEFGPPGGAAGATPAIHGPTPSGSGASGSSTSDRGAEVMMTAQAVVGVVQSVADEAIGGPGGSIDEQQ